MNLPLHFGLLGTLEAGLIALLVGLLVYALWHRLCRWAGWTDGHAIGWACVIAVRPRRARARMRRTAMCPAKRSHPGCS